MDPRVTAERGLGLLKLRIVAEVHRRERALRPLACFVGVELPDSPERHAALLRPDAILDDPRSLAPSRSRSPNPGRQRQRRYLSFTPAGSASLSIFALVSLMGSLGRAFWEDHL
jgi:hypothetical protein